MLIVILAIIATQLATVAAVFFLMHRQRKIMQMSTAGFKALLDAMNTLQHENISLAQDQVNLQNALRRNVDKTAMIEEVVKYLSETSE